MAKTKTIENLFNYLASYSHFLPILLFLAYLKKSISIRSLWIIIIYGLYNYLTDLGTLYVYHKPTQVFIYSSFTFFEYSFFAATLYFLIKSKGFKKIILILSLCFAAFIIPYNFLVKLRGIDSVPIGVETILILIFSFYYLYEQMKDTEDLFVYSRFSFWIVLAMMIYLSGSFFIYIYTSQLPDDKTIAKYWIFTNIFSILKNILFAIAILVNAYQPSKNLKKTMSYNLHLN